MAQKFHITENGPKPCEASLRDCKYGSSSHFESIQDAETAYELEMERQGHGAEGQSLAKEDLRERERRAQRVEELRDLLEDNLVGAAPSQVPLSRLKSVGEAIDGEIFRRLSLDPQREYFSDGELRAIAQENSKLLSELQGEPLKDALPKIHGPHGKDLKEAIGVLPTGAIALVSNDVHTVTVNARNGSRDGYHIAQAEVMAKSELEYQSSMKLGRHGVEGDYLVDSYIASRAEIEDGSLEGFAVMRVEKAADRPLRAGESALEATKRSSSSDRKFMELVDKGILDSSLKLVEGREDDFEREAPEYAETMRQLGATSSFYAGRKPTGRIARGKSYKKVADSFEIRDSSGKLYRVEKPLYELHEKTLSHSAHTIGTKNYGGDLAAKKPVLLHEFTHAVQSAAPGGIPGEREIFREVAGSSPAQRGDGYSFHRGFPDEYMGDQGGREVFTRATEGLFYPQYSDNGYLYKGATNSREIRQWALGSWAHLAKFGASRRAE